MFRRLFPTTIVLCVVATVSACAGYAPSADTVGQRREELIQQLGQPERETTADGKKKLHFPRGPGGSHTYFVYLNDEDRVVDWEQVLTEARFNQILPAGWFFPSGYNSRLSRVISCKPSSVIY
jgi:hypothetical protein